MKECHFTVTAVEGGYEINFNPYDSGYQTWFAQTEEQIDKIVSDYGQNYQMAQLLPDGRKKCL